MIDQTNVIKDMEKGRILRPFSFDDTDFTAQIWYY
jgi:hypothetical protein